MLTLIGTLRTVQEGSLSILGEELAGASAAKMVAMRRKLGFIFQAHNLFESLSAFQNVRMGMELFSFSKSEMTERITDLLTELDLGKRIHYKPGELSGGQKQRVAVARGLAHHPKLVLADEPTAALDKESGRKVVNLFRKMADEEGCTVLMVTHDNRIQDIADRVVNMVDGRIVSNVLVRQLELIYGFLTKSQVFANLTPDTLTRIAEKIFVEIHPAGTEVVRQGDPGRKFYLVRQGSVEVRRATDTGVETLAVLREGNFFGETALLEGSPRNASVVTLEDSLFYVLEKEDFLAIRDRVDVFHELRASLFSR